MKLLNKKQVYSEKCRKSIPDVDDTEEHKIYKMHQLQSFEDDIISGLEYTNICSTRLSSYIQLFYNAGRLHVLSNISSTPR